MDFALHSYLLKLDPVSRPHSTLATVGVLPFFEFSRFGYRITLMDVFILVLAVLLVGNYQNWYGQHMVTHHYVKTIGRK